MAPIALLSVSNKEGLLPLAKALHQVHGFELLSSGGTAKALLEGGLPVTKVSDYTGSPEILGGRVKTLHPKIHGGILAKRNDLMHKQELENHQINAIDVVVVNLYPFKETVSNSDVSWENAIENIDIGGPAMIRAAAKNHLHVSVLTRPAQYKPFLEAIEEGKGFANEDIRRKLALEAYEHTASYDIAISRWLANQIQSTDSLWFKEIPHQQTLRYGENPHQKATWYGSKEHGWGNATQIQGKELSTNNLLDLDAALSTVREFGIEAEGTQADIQTAAVVVKHTNPCGAAISDNMATAITKALDGDRVSAFGGIVAINRQVDAACAEILKSLFLECIVAPGYDLKAKEILASKPNLRLLELTSSALYSPDKYQFRSILGGVLVQDQDDELINTQNWKVATECKPSSNQYDDLCFAWRLVKHVRSNAIVVAKDGQTLGIGAGQMNRVGSAHIAIQSAGEQANGAVLASDGFFPFDDTVRLASSEGIKAIIQPGGSIKDKDSIEACNKLGIAMILTGKRHFLH